MEATLTPLPTELTPPPVTKTYLVVMGQWLDLDCEEHAIAREGWRTVRRGTPHLGDRLKEIDIAIIGLHGKVCQGNRILLRCSLTHVLSSLPSTGESPPDPKPNTQALSI